MQFRRGCPLPSADQRARKSQRRQTELEAGTGIEPVFTDLQSAA